MAIPKNETIPDDPEHLTPARRRRAQRLLAPLEVDERTAFADRLARRSSPTFDFFLLSLVAGLVLGIAFITDQPAILVLGALLAPLMSPVIGISLGAVAGSAPHFLRSLAGLLIGCLLVFLTGLVAGAAANMLQQTGVILKFSQAIFHAQFSWADFLVLAFGAGMTAATMPLNERDPRLPSVALAYELYIPLTVAGLGLTSGVAHLWPDGMVVFTVHLAWCVLIGAITLALIGFRPLTLFGYTLSGALALVGIILLVGLSGAGAVFEGKFGLPTAVPSPTLTPSPTLPPTRTPVPPTATITRTLPPTLTPTSTKTPLPSPTPVYAIVAALNTDGALLRTDPNGAILQSYFNGTVVRVLPDTKTVNGVIWMHIITPDGHNGWMLKSLLSPVPTLTPTP